MHHAGRTAVAIVMLSACVSFGQGDLTPPGAPAPMMKTLDQVEPRTPISSIPYSITNSGSYYLTTNCTGALGITIHTNDVTLDLNGFSLCATVGSGVAVQPPVYGIVVRNGRIYGCGTAGVKAWLCSGGLFENLLLEQNASDGISVGGGCTVRGCLARDNRDCGIYTAGKSLVSGCLVQGNYTNGILALSESVVENCVVNQNPIHGLTVSSHSTIRDNNFSGNGKTGPSGSAAIYVPAGQGANRIENNHVSDNKTGLRIDGIENFIRGNTVRGNQDNYAIGPSNHVDILLSQLPEVIDTPSHVTLTRSLNGVTGSNGITVAASDVTIDLNGFALIGGPSTVSGIATLGDVRSAVIRNGAIVSWGSDGVDLLRADDSRIEDVQCISNNLNGARMGNGCAAVRCNFRANDTGLSMGGAAEAVGCVATGNRSNGFDITHGRVTGCRANLNSDAGVRILYGSVTDCELAENGGDGVQVAGYGSALRNNCFGNKNDGIEVSQATVKENNCTLNGWGISIMDRGSQIVGNTLTSNTNYGLWFDSDATNGNYYAANVFFANGGTVFRSGTNQTGTYGNVNIFLP